MAFSGARRQAKCRTSGPIPNRTAIANSFAIGINDKDEVVGISTDLNLQFVATIWKDGVASDLNTLIPANSPLVLLSGCWINSKAKLSDWRSMQAAHIADIN